MAGSSNKDEGEINVSQFKSMIRQSTDSCQDSLNRSQEFLGGDASSRTVNNSSTHGKGNEKKPKAKWGAPVSPEQFRPDDWFGTPTSSKRKSYKIKSPAPSAVQNLPYDGTSSPSLTDESGHSQTSKPTIATTNMDKMDSSEHSFAASSLHTTDLPSAPPQIIPGVTRHTLGGTSSHHKATSKPHYSANTSSHSKTAEGAPDPEFYKTILRESLHQHEDNELNRSYEFRGENSFSTLQSSEHRSRVAGSSTNNSPVPGSFKPKWGKPEQPEQYRPDGWLGSPASAKRKSYKVKSASMPVNVAPPDLEGGKNESEHSAPSKGKGRGTITNNPKSPYQQQKFASPKIPRNALPGVTRHSLGGSSSHHKATSAFSKSIHNDNDDSSPDPEKYKAILRESIHQYDEDKLNRSFEIKGEDAVAPLERVSSHDTPTKHKWGAPVSPEQFRPTGWLGSPASATRKSYKVKSPSITSTVSPLDLATGSEHGTTTNGKVETNADTVTPESASAKPKAGASLRSRLKSRSLPIQQMENPPLAPSAAQARKLQTSPVAEEEQVDRQRFVDAFSAFEGGNKGPSIPSLFSNTSRTQKQHKTSVKKKSKSALPVSGRAWGSASSTSSALSPNQNVQLLNQAIAKLRPVTRVPNEDKKAGDSSDEKADVIMRMHNAIRNDTSETSQCEGPALFVSVIDNLRKNGILETYLKPEEMHKIQRIARDLGGTVDNLAYSDPSRIDMEVCVRSLNNLSPANARATGEIEDVISRLKKVAPKLPSELSYMTDDIVEELGLVHSVIATSEREQLAKIIRNIDIDELDGTDPDEDMDDLARVMNALNNLAVEVSSRLSDGSIVALPADISKSPWGRKPTISPNPEAQRNFKVSKKAKAKSLQINSLPFAPSSGEHDELQLVLNNLRRTAVTEKSNSVDKSKQYASELMQILNHLRNTGMTDKGAQELYGMMDNLRESGVISSNLGPNRMETLQQAIKKLERVRRNLNSQEDSYKEVSTVVKQLRTLTPTSAGAVEKLRMVVPRLRAIAPKLQSKDQIEVDEARSQIEAVLNSMLKGEEEQLAKAIDSLDGIADASDDNMRNVVNALQDLAQASRDDKLAEVDSSDVSPNHKSSVEFSPQSVDGLVIALVKLRKAKMTHREAATVAAVIRNLKKPETPEAEKASDEAIAKLKKQITSKRKGKLLADAMLDLRAVGLNDHDREHLAHFVRSMGTGKGKWPNEISEAISKLRKVQMNKKEAKEVSGILFNLRKTSRRGSDINGSREMDIIRRMMSSEKADIIADVCNDLGKLKLREKDIDRLAHTIAGLGLEDATPGDRNFITVEFEDGSLRLSLDLADNEHEMEQLGSADYIKKRTTYPTREFRFWIELDSEGCESDEYTAADESDFEEESDEEEEEDSISESKSSQETESDEETVPVQEPSEEITSVSKVLNKPTAKPAKKIHHDSAGQEQVEGALKLQEEREKRIKFSNKHHWRFKKHNNTIVREKRWRFEENFNVDEVVWSPLSREQYDRRKTVGASILKTLDKFAPMDDMILDEYERDDKGKKKTATKK